MSSIHTEDAISQYPRKCGEHERWEEWFGRHGITRGKLESMAYAELAELIDYLYSVMNRYSRAGFTASEQIKRLGTELRQAILAEKRAKRLSEKTKSKVMEWRYAPRSLQNWLEKHEVALANLLEKQEIVRRLIEEKDEWVRIQDDALETHLNYANPHLPVGSLNLRDRTNEKVDAGS